MLLTSLVEKKVCVGSKTHGFCLGVGLSLKSHAVKYLLCSASPRPVSKNSPADFSVTVSSVTSVDDVIELSRVRSAVPKNCAKFYLGLPVYSDTGAHLGNLLDLEIGNFTATTLYTDRNEVFPITAVAACSDAVILRKEQPYPLGQRVPAPFLPLLTDRSEAVLTKPLLRQALRKGALIKLTLSLPPFDVEFFSFPKR